MVHTKQNPLESWNQNQLAVFLAFDLAARPFAFAFGFVPPLPSLPTAEDGADGAAAFTLLGIYGR